MRIRVGTSGYSYKEWKGSFYPEDLPAAKMLEFYAARFGACEINNTFYRMPTAKVLEKWLGEVPPDFAFALKAPQQITHRLRLKEAAEPTRYFFETAGALGAQLGPTLVQLPPNLKKDLPRLDNFLALIPPDRRVAFEFRHPSWRDDEVHAVLRARGAALCIADTEDDRTPEVATADFGYLRLRRCDYTDADLEAWARRVTDKPWSEAWVFFKHEDGARGPDYATRLLRLFG